MLKVSSHIKTKIDEDLEAQNNLTNFKGMYFNDTHEQKYYEGGAHFRYRDLCSRLEKIVSILTPERKGRSMYEDYQNEGEISKKKLEVEYNSSLAKTKADSRKIVSDSSKENLIEKNSFGKYEKKPSLTIDKSNISIENKIIKEQNKSQSRNYSLNNNYTNNYKNLYGVTSISKETPLNIMRTCSDSKTMKKLDKNKKPQQHTKSNSMTIVLNQLNNNSSHNTNSESKPSDQSASVASSINCKKIQPKILKNSLIGIPTKLNTNYVEILNKRINKNENSYSRNQNMMGNEFMRVGNNTKNNITSTNNNMPRMLNSSGLNNSNYDRERSYSLSATKNLDVQQPNDKPKVERVLSYNTGNQKKGVTSNFNMSNININMNFTNSRNHKVNEISTLSEITSSIKKNKYSDARVTNVIVKPKINISFVNNINNMLTSMESNINTINANPSQTYVQNLSSSSVVNNKKSRNDRVDNFLKNDSGKMSNTNKTMKNVKYSNFKAMITGIGNGNNSKSKSRNIKNQYSINFDTLSKGNTIDKDNTEEPKHKKTSSIVIDEKKLIRNTFDNIFNVNTNTNTNITGMNLKKNTQNNKIHSYAANNFTMNNNFNNVINKEKDISVLNSNCMNLKQKINNLKLGLNTNTNTAKKVVTNKPITNSGGKNTNSNSNNKPNKFLMNTKTIQKVNMTVVNDTISSFVVNRQNYSNPRIRDTSNKPKIK